AVSEGPSPTASPGCERRRRSGCGPLRGRRRRSGAGARLQLSCGAPWDEDFRLAPAGTGRAGFEGGLGDVAAGGRLDGGDDLHVAGAAADVPHELLEDLLAARVRVPLEHGSRREDEARRAEAALEPVLLVERGLHRREVPWLP